MLSLLEATLPWQELTHSQVLAGVWQEFLRCVSPNLGLAEIPTRWNVVWRGPGQLPPLDITCHFPYVQAHLSCAWSVAGGSLGAAL